MNSDITVIGGGLTGAAVALQLAQAGWSVAVLDKAAMKAKTDFAKPMPPRVSALTLASEVYLEDLGLAPTIKQHAANIECMRVWDSRGSGEVTFSSRLLGKDHLALVMPNAFLLEAMKQALAQCETVTWLEGTCEHVNFSDNEAVVTLSDGDSIASPLVVGAEGANSWLRKQLGVSYHASPYEHTAIVATLKTERPHQQTAWQSFSPQGPLAYLPLQDPHEVSIVWSQTTDKAKQLLSLGEAEFAKHCAQALESRLGKVALATTRISFPLQRAHAKSYVRARAALIGDAIHSIHPLAGQGLNLGLLDAKCLADCVIQARSESREWGRLPILRRFERARKGYNLAMIGLMECFHRGFCSESESLTVLRNLGLTAVDNWTFAKKFFIQKAMGL